VNPHHHRDAGSPYHNGNGRCWPKDHQCVDGLICKVGSSGNLACLHSNPDDNGSIVKAFHQTSRCVVPNLDHSWFGTHREANFLRPNDTLTDFPTFPNRSYLMAATRSATLRRATPFRRRVVINRLRKQFSIC